MYGSTFLDLDSSWSWVASFTSRKLHPQGKSPRSHWNGGCVGPGAHSTNFAVVVESREYGRWDPLRWPRDTLYSQKLVLTSPTRGGPSAGIVRSPRSVFVGLLIFISMQVYTHKHTHTHTHTHTQKSRTLDKFTYHSSSENVLPYIWEIFTENISPRTNGCISCNISSIKVLWWLLE
jgi:hypothetical protein